jgi:hypothetical protein
VTEPPKLIMVSARTSSSRASRRVNLSIGIEQSGGNPYLRFLRSQLEKHIAEELGKDHLLHIKAHAELRKIKKEISGLKKKLDTLQERRAYLEAQLKKK